MFSQVDDTEASIGQLLFKVVLLLDIALIGVHKHGRVAATRLGT